MTVMKQEWEYQKETNTLLCWSLPILPFERKLRSQFPLSVAASISWVMVPSFGMTATTQFKTSIK